MPEANPRVGEYVYAAKVRELLKTHGEPPKEVYLDLENSGLVPPEVVEAMLPYFNVRGYGHPSITHKKGWEALEVLYETKEILTKTLGARDVEEVEFTHSGTEANNLAVLGYLFAARGRGRKVIVSAVEHLSVIFPAEFAAKLLGYEVVKVPVDREGFVNPELLKQYVDRETVLVSIQAVNHEIGTVQPLRDLVDVAKSANPNVVFHTDAADALGWIPLNVADLNVDMVTLSSHKIGGPRGVGALYVRDGVRLEPPIRGQLSGERLWPGVENVPIIAGFKRALELEFEDFDWKVSYVKGLRDKLIHGLLDRVPETIVNGPLGEKRVANNANLSFLYVEGEALTVELSMRGVYVSSGSACSSRILEPSHVLLAIGRKHEEAHGSILFKLSRHHKPEDVEYVIESVPEAVSRLRALSSWRSAPSPPS
ncbi:MAG: cysteine desulfurase [Thermofilaceae archaeon]|nr:cysteine desulfurase [Thermofilaceae archaeon]MCX8181344.1 cysteine desulfurase [Thermofilaceae archaeon]MDW8003587.1 cysteine desulfurase family protein [Thermofilaceae archaeon]